MNSLPEILSWSDVTFLPIVSAYVKKIGIVEEIDRLCNMESDVRPGHVVSLMIMDTLSGRSPLYRLEKFAAGIDTELLLGEQVEPSKFNDDAVGRVLDRIADVGPGFFLTAICLNVVKLYDLDLSHVHHDTTSHTFYGAYDLYPDPDHSHSLVITLGHNKDHRPDLKQLVHSLLCVDHGIPIRSKLENGNASDKTINTTLIGEIVDRMRQLGASNFLYVADSTLITPTNLRLMNDPEKGFRFVSRLPESYNECKDAIERAVKADQWEDLGNLNKQPATKKRKPAFYRGFETTVTLYNYVHRALVIHSDAHDRQKTKKLTKEIAEEHKNLTKLKVREEKIRYACLPDAESAVCRIAQGRFHRLVSEIYTEVKYGRGKPKADGSRNITATTYRLKMRLERNEAVIASAEQRAGCFVLISNALRSDADSVSSEQLLSIYKDQGYVERNFGFLKDPLIVNSLFLKSPARIEALGLILVLSLMVWRLMERTMRLCLKQKSTTITGWDKKQTSRPTSFMMSTYFHTVLVIQTPRGRILGTPLSAAQLDYLAILGLSADIFLHAQAQPSSWGVGSIAKGPAG